MSRNKWLDDVVINLGQSMLQEKFPHIGGLQSVVLAEKFALIPQTGEFLQVLNVNNNHWVLLSTIGCPPATVNVYDSLHSTLSSTAQRVVADILQSPAAHITLRYIDVQWQSNTYDCLPWQTQLHCAMEWTPAQLHLIILNYVSISSPVSSTTI